jgi:hypothetical protein
MLKRFPNDRFVALTMADVTEENPREVGSSSASLFLPPRLRRLRGNAAYRIAFEEN